MNDKLQEALERVETTYGELVEIANDIIGPIVKHANSLIENINSRAYSLTIEQIRDSILAVQLAAYQLAEVKEKSAMKAEVADALQKERFAINFNSVDGSAAVKDKLALVANAPEIATSALYNLIASLLKTKLDSLYRMVDSLKSILMSRMQETKFSQFSSNAEIPATVNTFN